MQGRVFLVLIGGIVVSVLLTASLADREGRRTFAQVRAAHTADRVEQLVTALEAVPPEVRATLAATLGRGMTAQFAGPEAPGQEVDADLTAALAEEFGADRTVVATAGTSADCVTQSGDSAAVDRSDARPCRVISLRLRDGTPLRLILRPQPEFSWTRPHSSRWLLYAIFFPVCLGLLAYVIARMATRPLNQLAQAATELGGDINRAPLVERGPAEVRDAAAVDRPLHRECGEFGVIAAGEDDLRRDGDVSEDPRQVDVLKRATATYGGGHLARDRDDG